MKISDLNNAKLNVINRSCVISFRLVNFFKNPNPLEFELAWDADSNSLPSRFIPTILWWGLRFIVYFLFTPLPLVSPWIDLSSHTPLWRCCRRRQSRTRQRCLLSRLHWACRRTRWGCAWSSQCRGCFSSPSRPSPSPQLINRDTERRNNRSRHAQAVRLEQALT